MARLKSKPLKYLVIAGLLYGLYLYVYKNDAKSERVYEPTEDKKPAARNERDIHERPKVEERHEPAQKMVPAQPVYIPEPPAFDKVRIAPRILLSS